MIISVPDFAVNSATVGRRSSAANRLTGMGKAKPLSEDQLAAAARLRRIWDEKRGALGLTQDRAAQKLGFETQSAVSQYLNAVVPLNVEAVLKFAVLLEVRPRDIDPKAAQLAEEAISRNGDLLPSEPRPAQYALGKRRKDGVLDVPQLDVSASMGHGILPPEHIEVVTQIALRVSELKKQLLNTPLTSPQNLRFITGFGNSMLPLFADGDILLVDTGVTDVKIDAVYVFELGDQHELFIKTLQRIPGSRAIKMISNNRESFDPHLIEDPEKAQMVVRGRVLLAWNARRL